MACCESFTGGAAHSRACASGVARRAARIARRAGFMRGMLSGSLRLLAQEHVRGALAGDALVTLVAERMEVEAMPEMLARAHQHGTKREVQLVAQPRLQVLAPGGDAAADAYVLAAGRLARLL